MKAEMETEPTAMMLARVESESGVDAEVRLETKPRKDTEPREESRVVTEPKVAEHAGIDLIDSVADGDEGAFEDGMGSEDGPVMPTKYAGEDPDHDPFDKQFDELDAAKRRQST